MREKNGVDGTFLRVGNQKELPAEMLSDLEHEKKRDHCRQWEEWPEESGN